MEVHDVSLSFGGRKLFENVNLKFAPDNCYGIIGANGAGKSTFLKILSGEIQASTGNIVIASTDRMAVLKQNHFEYNQEVVLNTVIMGHKQLYEVMQEREALYAKPEDDFTEADGMRIGELEGDFADIGGYEAESNAGILLNGLGITEELHQKKVEELLDGQKVKVLLAQALFGNPEILLLDEPTNHLDVESIEWLENFLLDYQSTVLVVSHDRHFLNKVCTHTVDIDFGKIQLYIGNYDFWKQSSELAHKMTEDSNKKKEDKIKELEDFIRRFSANASKSKQATSRKKQLDKINLDDIRPSSRKYPYIHFDQEREVGREILNVSGLHKKINDEDILVDFNLMVDPGDKIAFVGSNDIAKTAFFDCIMAPEHADKGTITWGQTTTREYYPKDNSSYFDGNDLSLVDWLRQYSEEKAEDFIRGFLGRMLFSGDNALKEVKVLSGGEKARLMYSKMMLAKPNVIILDGPTDHLDLESIESVNKGLMDFPGIIFINSHDHNLISSVANRIVEIKGTQVHDKKQNYEEFLAERK